MYLYISKKPLDCSFEVKIFIWSYVPLLDIAFIKLEKGFPFCEMKIFDPVSTQMKGIPMDNTVGHQRHGKPLQTLQCKGSHLKNQI